MPPQQSNDRVEQGDHAIAQSSETQEPNVSRQQWSDMSTLRGPDSARKTAEHTLSELFGAPTIVGADGTVYLHGQVSNVPEVSHGVQNLDDVKAFGTGITRGLLHAGQETLEYLAMPGAVESSLLQIGPALDTAVNYYTNTPPDRVLRDAQGVLGYAGQALEDALGHPLKPEQLGEHAGVAMAAFFPIGANKALTEKELQALGGVKKLEQMAPRELEALGLRKVDDYGLTRLTKEQLGLSDQFDVFEASRSMKNGEQTVSFDYIHAKEVGQTNLPALMTALERNARAEGAHSLRIEAEFKDPDLERVFAKRYNVVRDEHGRYAIVRDLTGEK